MTRLIAVLFSRVAAMTWLCNSGWALFLRSGRDRWVRVVLVAAFVFAEISSSAAAAPEGSGKPARRPNVIVLLVDDLGYGDIGAYGCPDISTPNIDALAKEGARCTNGYTLCNLCSPSRVGLMTGMYPERFGIYGNTDRGQPIPADHLTLAEFMRGAGYVTGMVGRWDIGDSKQGPLERGFMEVARRAPRVHPEKTDWPTYIGTDGSYATEMHGKELVDFVERHRAEPFFLYFSPLAIHSPVEDVPQKYLERTANVTPASRHALAGTLVALDDTIGKLLAKLRELQLDDDTIIFFTGDNGGWLPDHARNAPFRGGKVSGWDGGVHEPYIVRWNGHIPAGRDYTGLVSTLDIYATAAALTGKEAPSQLDGVDLLPYLQGRKEGDPHDALFWSWESATTYYSHSVRSGSMRYMVEGDHGQNNERRHLFDLGVDPGETNDLIAARVDLAANLAEQLNNWKSGLPAWVKRTGLPQREPPTGEGWAKPQDPDDEKDDHPPGAGI